MLKPTDIAREFAYPLHNAAVWMSLMLLFLLLEFAIYGGVLGLFLAFLILPALLRYLMRILEARSRGRETGPLVVDDLLWIGSSWSLFVVVHIAVLIYATNFLGSRYGWAAMLAGNAILAAVIPASLAVLAVTRSPVESLNPRSIGGVIHRCGAGYWVLPSYILFAIAISWWLSTRPWAGFATELFVFYLAAAFFALVGGVFRPHQLHEEVDIDEPAEPDQQVLGERLLKERTAALNHAYGFISRDNRAGGFNHIQDSIGRDPDPDDAWSWFFDQMMLWEIQGPAQLFAQNYLTRLLHDGDYAKAVKVMTRCRYANESFLPLTDDRALAREAAEACGDEELVGMLERSLDRD